jgi:ABC-type branched-subunit amino acid transport system substrate-binding protein
LRDDNSHSPQRHREHGGGAEGRRIEFEIADLKFNPKFALKFAPKFALKFALKFVI